MKAYLFFAPFIILLIEAVGVLVGRITGEITKDTAQICYVVILGMIAMMMTERDGRNHNA